MSKRFGFRVRAPLWLALSLCVIVALVYSFSALRPGAAEPEAVIIDISEREAWIDALAKGADVEFRRQHMPSGDNALVARVESLGPVSVQSRDTMIDDYKRLSEEGRLTANEASNRVERSDNFYEAYRDYLTQEMIVLTNAAVATLVEEGRYITYRGNFDEDLFPRDEYSYAVYLGATLPSGDLVEVIVPIPYDKFPDLLILKEEVGKLSDVMLGEYIFDFNSKPDSERQRLYEDHISAREELGRLLREARADGGSVSAEDVVPLNDRMLPGRIVVTPPHYIAQRIL